MRLCIPIHYQLQTTWRAPPDQVRSKLPDSLVKWLAETATLHEKVDENGYGKSKTP